MIDIKQYDNLGLNMKATYERISELINESSFTDRELAEIMGLSVQSINKWRHGQNLPDTENLFILSRLLKRSIEEFLVPLSNENQMVIVNFEVEQNRDFSWKHLEKYRMLLMQKG